VTVSESGGEGVSRSPKISNPALGESGRQIYMEASDGAEIRREPYGCQFRDWTLNRFYFARLRGGLIGDGSAVSERLRLRPDT
jgi:hypothetical protein